ncbi:Ankyrin repeats (3 copies) family protein [Brugia pahangi]
MKLQSLSLRYHGAAMAYAVRAGDHDLQYRCLLSKINFSGDQRLKTAIELVHVASNLDQQASCEAKFILAQEKIRAKDFVGAKWDLISMLASKAHEKLDAEEQRSFHQILITAYKTIERLRALPDADEHFKMKINEKVADSLYEIGFCEISLEYYKQMLTYACQTEDKIKALVSVAETAKELDRYEEALNCFVEVENLENTLNISSAKKADTSLCIASAAANVDSFTPHEVLELFRKSECLAIYNHQKKTLYENMLAYMNENDVDRDLRIEIEAKLISLGNDKENDGKRSENDEETDENFVDEWDDLSDTQILARCYEEANRHSMEERIRSEKDKKINLYGETRMHEAARGSDTHHLKMLIEMGYNINARDEGGWTPLHEAVGALKLENVHILAQLGANLNMRSNEGTLSAEGERTDSGGLTPLMEACDRGATAIVDLLLKFGANVAIKNRDDWTALDFLRNAIKVGMVEDDVMKEAKRLVSVMETKLKEANIVVNAEPPPKKLKLNDKTKPKTNSSVACAKIRDSNLSNLNEYRKTMDVVGRGTTHDRINVLLDGLDVDGTSSDEDEKDEMWQTRHLSPTVDGSLVDINDFTESPSAHQASSSSNFSSSLLSKQKIAGTETEEIAQMKQKFSACDELLCNSNSTALPDLFTAPESNQSKRNRRSLKRNSGEDSDEDIVISRPAAQSTQSRNISSTELKHPRRCNVENSTIVSRVSSSPFTPPSVKNQIFIKIIMTKDDGTHLKTKGMPFASSCFIGDIRERCKEELKGDVEYTSMTICHDDCELSDDTPIELVLGDQKILKCIISGLAKPSAAQIYAKRTRRLMTNVLHALSESTNGFLDLREMNIGQDDAVCAAVEVLQSNILKLYLDGNSLSTSFIDLISKIVRHLTSLSLPCCALKSGHLRQLINDYSVCDALAKLDLSYNNLSDNGSDQVVTFVSLCPNLTDLKLASCNINRNVINCLIQQIKKIISLEVLDLSFNSEINSDHASEIIHACRNLKYLDLSCTAISKMDNMPEVERKLEIFKLSLNNLNNPDYIMQWSLVYCPHMLFLDLSATTVVSSIVEICLKIKADKMPFITVLLADCSLLEANPEEVVRIIKAALITSSTVRFQFSSKFRRKIEEMLPDSYKFCLK